MAQAPSRCLNHPERTAVARCKQCHKPLCQRCVQKMPGGIFCSDECYQKMGGFKERVDQLDQARKPGISIGKWLTRLVVLAVVLGILYYVFIYGGVRSVEDFVELIKGLLP
jgi:hypothetical protein